MPTAADPATGQSANPDTATTGRSGHRRVGHDLTVTQEPHGHPDWARNRAVAAEVATSTAVGNQRPFALSPVDTFESSRNPIRERFLITPPLGPVETLDRLGAATSAAIEGRNAIRDHTRGSFHGFVGTRYRECGWLVRRRGDRSSGADQYPTY